LADSLFTQIRKGLIPGEIVYKDEKCFAITDINPQAPTHILIIPNKQIEKISDSTETDIELLGHLIHASKAISKKFKLDNNYRLIINNGAQAGQSIFHLHVHLLGGKKLNWPQN
jgi:histidine triad (HIT) family protein